MRDWEARLLPAWGLLAVVGLLSAGTVEAQAFPPQYANALSRTEYTIFTGDINGDQLPDVLAKAKTRVAVVDIDVFVPIVLKPVSATFVLLSQGGNPYILDSNPSTATINSSIWQPAAYTKVFGDVIGNGSSSLLLHARTPGATSFLITTSASNGSPTLLQELSTSSISYDLSAAGVSVTLVDTNRDGRADLTLRTDGFITAVLTANSQGIFARPVNDADNIMVAWRSFCASLDAGDVNSAARFITVDGQSIYVPVLQGLGAALTGVTVSWSQPKAISVGNKVALYGMRDNTGGANELHTLLFMREDGRWLLSAF